MTLEQLKCFLAVAEYLSYRRAAEVLFMSRSAVSRSVSLLEADLHAKLLDRDNHGVRLTHIGELLKERGLKILSLVNDTVSEITYSGAGMTGRLLVSTSDTYDSRLFNVFTTFTNNHKDILFKVQKHRFESVPGRVLNGESDIGVTFSYAVPENNMELEVKKLWRERFCLAVAENNTLVKGDTVTAEELRKLYIASIRDKATDLPFIHELDRRIGRYKYSSVGLLLPESLDDMLNIIRASDEGALLPRPTALLNSTGCRVLEIENVDTGFDMVMLWRKDINNPYFQPFMDVVEKTFGA